MKKKETYEKGEELVNRKAVKLFQNENLIEGIVYSINLKSSVKCKQLVKMFLKKDKIEKITCNCFQTNSKKTKNQNYLHID